MIKAVALCAAAFLLVACERPTMVSVRCEGHRFLEIPIGSTVGFVSGPMVLMNAEHVAIIQRRRGGKFELIYAGEVAKCNVRQWVEGDQWNE